MSKYSWNYEELGFKSDAEMRESIARVERKMNMTREERVREEKRNQFTKGNRGFSFEAMEEGARLSELDRVVHNRINHDRQQAKLQAEQEKRQEIMAKLDKSIEEENRANAERELRKEKEKLEVELQNDIYSKHNIKTDEEQELNDSLMGMLKNSKHISQK